MNQLASCPPRPRALHTGISRAGFLVDHASTFVCGLAIGVLVMLLVGTVIGYRPLIDHSDSMRPAIRAGDLLITRTAAAMSIHPGDIVTFSDRPLRGKLVTHRVRSRYASGTRIDFVTRGDANPTSESWSVDRRASIGRLVLRVPAVGRSMAWLAEPWPRTVLLSLAGLVLSTALLRRIWKA